MLRDSVMQKGKVTHYTIAQMATIPAPSDPECFDVLHWSEYHGWQLLMVGQKGRWAQVRLLPPREWALECDFRGFQDVLGLRLLVHNLLARVWHLGRSGRCYGTFASRADPHQRLQVMESEECYAYGRQDVGDLVPPYTDIATYCVMCNGLNLSAGNRHKSSAPPGGAYLISDVMWQLCSHSLRRSQRSCVACTNMWEMLASLVTDALQSRNSNLMTGSWKGVKTFWVLHL